MPVPSNENYVAWKLIGNGSRSIEARMAAVEGILQYGPQDPEYFPDIDARKLSVFAFDENGNPGYLSLNRITGFVPLALELAGPPVAGELLYTVTGTVSYENGGGINYAIPGSFPRIPNYNGKDAFSTTGTILPDVNDATDLPYAQGYFDAVYYRLDLKTAEGISRFFSIDPSPDSGIQDADNWTGYGSETNPNTISITPPQSATVADPGQFIEDTTDQNSSYIKGWQRLHRFPEIDQYGFLKVSGVIPRTVSAAQLNNIPRTGELVTLSDYEDAVAVGKGGETVADLTWLGTQIITLTNSSALQLPTNPDGNPYIILRAEMTQIIITGNLSTLAGKILFVTCPSGKSRSFQIQCLVNSSFDQWRFSYLSPSGDFYEAKGSRPDNVGFSYFGFTTSANFMRAHFRPVTPSSSQEPTARVIATAMDCFSDDT